MTGVSENLLLSLAAVIVLGVGAQWLAWRLRIASILLLLLLGFAAGPLAALLLDEPLLDPDHLMGDLLLPFVSIAVALILYEGGLTLRFAELREAGRLVGRLVTVGAITTWILAALAAWRVLGLPPDLSILLGAILVVTGPTVVGPLLREIRPSGRVGAILKWEGIVIDPIGAMLAVLVFEAILLGDPSEAATHVAFSLLRIVIVGSALGFGAGYLLALLLRLFWIPDRLENAVSIMFVVAVYALAQEMQEESGLFAATVMGITLANQKLADVRHIVEFKENLRVLLISSLFILLAARVDLEGLRSIGPGGLAFLGLLVVVIRPVSVLISRLGLGMTRGEFALLAVMAPRGIVAAAVASVFSLRLLDKHPEAASILPLTFMVIVGTVLISSLIAKPVAQRFGVAEPNPQGVLLVGAHAWARAVGEALREHDIRVVVVDTNRANLAAARMAGLETYSGSILAEHALEEIDLGGLGRLIAATPNDWVNTLTTQRLLRLFGRGEVYQVPPGGGPPGEKEIHRHLHARWLFDRSATYAALAGRVARGATIRATSITEEFTIETFREHHGEHALPMFILSSAGRLHVIVDGEPPAPGPGDTLISLVDAED
ncbi:MAG: cation:proton antiporter [Planctomycetota bacterium]